MLQQEQTTQSFSLKAYEKAYNDFIKKYDPYISGQAYQLAKNFKQDEADVKQELLLYVWQYGKKWNENDGPVNPYFYRLLSWAVQSLVRSWTQKARLKEYNASSFERDDLETSGVLDQSSEMASDHGWVSDSYGRVEKRVIARDYLKKVLQRSESFDTGVWACFYSLLDPTEQARLSSKEGDASASLEVCSLAELEQHVGMNGMYYFWKAVRRLKADLAIEI